MNPLKLIPGYSALSHISGNLMKGLREDGLIGAVKVVAKGLSKDWALGLAALVIPGAQILAGATLASAGADLLGATKLRSERGGEQRQQQQPEPQGAGSW